MLSVMILVLTGSTIIILLMLNGREKGFGLPKRGCVVHNNTEHHGTNIDPLWSCIFVWGVS